MNVQPPLFDLISALRESYQFIWRARVALFHAASLPFLVKFGLFVIVVLLGLEDDFLRQGLVFVPSYFLEGWLVAFALRRAVYGEGLKSLPARDVLASAQIYTLVKLLSALLVGVLFSMGQSDGEAIEFAFAEESPPLRLLLAGGALVFLFWSFRFMWLNVPVALGFSMKSFLVHIRGFTGSFRLMGLFFLVYLPIFFFTLIIYDLLGAFFPGHNLADGSIIYKMCFGLLQSVIELITAIITGIAVGHGFMQVIRRK